MKRTTRQRMLQVGMGIVLIFLAFLLEMVIIEPSGIYSYSHYGYKQFKIGLSRQDLLGEVNRVTAIRRIITCDSPGPSSPAPSAGQKLTSRRSFEMTEDLTRSRVWICQGKKKVGFLFQFQGDRLARVLRLKVRFFEEGSFPLFNQCQPGIYQDMDGYLNTQTIHEIFYGDEARQSE